MKRPSLDREIMKACSQVSAWRSIALCLAIAGAIFALAWVGGSLSGFKLSVPAFILIAGLQHHLLTLQHEGAHRLLHPNARLNDLVADVFCAVPFFTLVRNYRLFHLLHHKHVGSREHDPEVIAYRNEGFEYRRARWPRVLRMFAADLLLLNFLRFARDNVAFQKKHIEAGRLEPFGARDAALNLIVWGGAITAAVWFGFWVELLVFWVLPYTTLTFFFLKLHGYGEHTGATGPTEFERTWVHLLNPVVDFFLYPIRSGFHLEHHLFPKVPWYHMKAFRRALVALPGYSEQAALVTANGYVFGERSILRSMLVGEGEYRVDQVAGTLEEQGGVSVSEETAQE
ncbi:MAG: fatty acid desaturase family protein, partial [Planctomycetota bacterium]